MFAFLTFPLSRRQANPYFKKCFREIVIPVKLSFIDCSIAGVSGDMLTAALIDAGAPAEKVRRAMLRAGGLFGDVKVKIKRVRVNEIKATRVEVESSDEGGRTCGEIVKRLGQISLPPKISNAAVKTLRTLAEAEARVHGKHLDQLVLHEVGAADAVADIVGCCTAADELGLLECEVLASEVAVGKGTTVFAHGRLPLPAPATLEILRGKPIRGVPVNAELTTPTGAALLVTLANKFIDAYPAMRVDKIGYGIGTLELPMPDLVRICLGEPSGLELQKIAVLETNVDNISGEAAGYALEKLMQEGALDASVAPLLMKKGRPGFLIMVIAESKDSERLARVLMRETGTLGVRLMPLVHRYALARDVKKIDFVIAGRKFRPRVKIAKDGREVVGLTAEYEDAKEIAEKTDLPFREVKKLIEDAARRKIR